MAKQTTGRVSSKRLEQDLRTDGGFTVHEETGDRPDQGVAVADWGAEAQFPQRADVRDIENYRRDHARELRGPRRFFGGWASESEGDFLDVSQVVGTRREAFAIGQVNAQRAVMDLGSFEEHSVPYPPGLPGPGRTGMSRKEYGAAEAKNRELGRRMIENQRLGRQVHRVGDDPGEARRRGEMIADDLFEREQLHKEVRGRHPRAQARRGRT